MLIVALSQGLIYYVFLLPAFGDHAITPLLSDNLIWLFILDTILIAAAGYVVNDIYDMDADRSNKPDKTYIGDCGLSRSAAWLYYGFLVLSGGVIAIYIALTINKPLLFIIYPVACALLYFYSSFFKCRPLSGNIIVSVFCAFVPGIIWYAESEGVAQLQEKQPALILLFAAYILFGLIATLVREIVKDIEDIDGDRKEGCKTFPITAGVERAKMMAFTNMVLLIISYSMWMLAFYRLQAWISLGLLVIFLVIPSFALVNRISRAQLKKDFSDISKWIKYLMLLSLILFITTQLEL